MADPQQALVQMILAGLVVALVAGVPAFALYRRIRPTSLLPAYRERPVAWSGVAVLACFVFSLLLGQTIAPAILGQTGFFNALYGPDFPTKLSPEILKDPTQQRDAHLIILWSQAFAIPLAITAIYLGVNLATGARTLFFEPDSGRVGAHLVLGYVFWLVLTPIVFGVFLLATSLLSLSPDTHPLTDLGNHAGKREWLIFAIQVSLLAPINEELLFRGLLLPWLAPPRAEEQDPHFQLQPRFRSDLIYGLALVMPSTGLIDALLSGHWDALRSPPPTLIFLITLLPLYNIFPRSVQIQRMLGIPSVVALKAAFASAALFAAFHAGVWPSPIPLFFLGLGLAWLALRTRGIVASIVVHSLFNSVAVVYMGLGWLGLG